MKENNWQDTALTLAVSKYARITNYATFRILRDRRVNTVGEAIRYGKLKLAMSKGFGKKYCDAVSRFISENDKGLAAKFDKNQTAESWCMEGYNYLND